jgi:hypothetical protein
MDKIVSFISSVLITEALAPFDVDEKRLRETGPVVFEKIKKMPYSMKALVYISTYVFDWASVLYSGCRFSAQNIEQRKKTLQLAGQCRWRPLRQFLRFYRKMALFIYYLLLEDIK